MILGSVVAIGTLVFGAFISLLTDLATPNGQVDESRSVAVAPDIGENSFDESFARGVEFFRRGRPAEARKAFESAIRTRPHVPEAHTNLGFANLALGKSQPAEDAFRTAIGLRPEQANAYFGLAESLEQRGDLVRALDAMRTYINLVPEDDPHRRRAMSAVWEWRSSLSASGRGATEQGSDRTAIPRERGKSDTFAERLGSLSLVGLDSQPVDLNHIFGKFVVLNVWATWCAPCREELPSLQRLAGRLDPEKFAVIGIAVDEDLDFVREFLRDAGVRYANYLDSGGKSVVARLGVRSYPQTFLIDGSGKLVERVEGIRAWDQIDIERLDQISTRNAGRR